MPQPRRTAWALLFALVASLTIAGPSGVVLAAEPKPQCTGWTDEMHPPTTIRVLRSNGPNAGKVEVANFWNYVGAVLRAEYSSGADKPANWMWVGSITVKQYAWYYAGHWRGGKTADGTCYDVKDTTADQIYKPETNIPTSANLKAMRETWHMSMRKWVPDKNFSRLFLTGYRSGQQNPCGADSTGWKIFQKSLRDCGVKGLDLEETLREYFEPMLPVDTRGNDVLYDGQSWYGDLGMLGPGAAGASQWRLYAGTPSGFGNPVVGSFANVPFGSVLSQGIGNLDAGGGDGSPDWRLLADLLMLSNNGGVKLFMARGTGAGFAPATQVNLPAGTAAERLLVADFDGDMLSDAGLLSTVGPGQARLVVMRSTGSGPFGAPVQWWTGPLNLAAGDFASAGDTNGDGKADLILRTASGGYSVATSNASCAVMTAWGACPSVGPVGLGALAPWLGTGWPAADVKHLVGDYDRDGRDDLIVILNSAGGIKVLGLRSKVDGGFADPAELWQSSAVPFAEVIPVALDVNPDGMADVALVRKNGDASSLMWLRAVERSASPASMTATTPLADATLTWNPALRPF
jgi:hypothetical protein